MNPIKYMDYELIFVGSSLCDKFTIKVDFIRFCISKTVQLKKIFYAFVNKS